MRAPATSNTRKGSPRKGRPVASSMTLAPRIGKRAMRCNSRGAFDAVVEVVIAERQELHADGIEHLDGRRAARQVAEHVVAEGVAPVQEQEVGGADARAHPLQQPRHGGIAAHHPGALERLRRAPGIAGLRRGVAGADTKRLHATVGVVQMGDGDHGRGVAGGQGATRHHGCQQGRQQRPGAGPVSARRKSTRLVFVAGHSVVLQLAPRRTTVRPSRKGKPCSRPAIRLMQADQRA